MTIHRPTRTTTRAAAALGLAVALGIGLTACGSDDTTGQRTTEVSTTEHNDADVTFASDMIQHHAQALSMVDLTLTLDRELDPDVQQLAEDIRAAQGPEIETMADWLTTWGEEVPETMRDHVNSGHDMGDMGNGEEMPGMMAAEDMSTLENASDADFQDMWLEMMKEHHQGAVEMAEAEQRDGQFKDAVDLAAQIVDTQSAEIEAINGILGSE